MNLTTDLLGGIAATLTTIAFIPQVFHILKTKNTSSISLKMYLLFATGVFLWFLYGILLTAWPVIVANPIVLVLAVWIIILKLRHG